MESNTGKDNLDISPPRPLSGPTTKETKPSPKSDGGQPAQCGRPPSNAGTGGKKGHRESLAAAQIPQSPRIFLLSRTQLFFQRPEKLSPIVKLLFQRGEKPFEIFSLLF